MKKIFLPLTVLCLFITQLSCYAATGDKTPEDNSKRNQKIYEVTSRDLSSFLENIPVGFEKQHGFNNREEFKKAVAGTVYTILGVDENWNTFSTDLYNLPVLVDNEYRAMITVSHKNGIYDIETVGAAMLAAELQQIEPVPGNGQDYIMLNVYSKASGFVAYPPLNTAVETANFIPLESAKTTLNSLSREIQPAYPLSQLINILKAN